MSYSKLVELINAILPEHRVFADIKNVLIESNFTIEMDEGSIAVDKTVELEIISRSFVDDLSDSVLTPLKVCVAIGGGYKTNIGLFEAKYCFSILHYDEKSNLVTIDFTKSLF